MVQIIRELPLSPAGAQHVLVQHGSKFYVVSSFTAKSGFETLVFPANEDGDMTDWTEVAGGRGMSREEAIRDLAEQTE